MTTLRPSYAISPFWEPTNHPYVGFFSLMFISIWHEFFFSIKYQKNTKYPTAEWWCYQKTFRSILKTGSRFKIGEFEHKTWLNEFPLPVMVSFSSYIGTYQVYIWKKTKEKYRYINCQCSLVSILKWKWSCYARYCTNIGTYI